jgi:hypothetical protein
MHRTSDYLLAIQTDTHRSQSPRPGCYSRMLHDTSHEPQQLHTLQLAVVPCVSYQEGEITIKSLRATALFTGWRGIWMRRLTSAIVHSPWLISSLLFRLPCRVKRRSLFICAPHRSIPPWDHRHRHTRAQSSPRPRPPATSGLQTGIAHARGCAFTMVRMLVAKL